MGMIINIDKALELRSDYNVLKEPLHAMMKNQQELWEKENPIDMLFNRGSLSSFQETYTSSIGFDHAFSETSDYAVGPIFNTAEGFSATYRSRTFQGGFIISQQTLEDGDMGKIKDNASAFVKRWQGDVVEYSMKGIEGGFASGAVDWVGGDGKVTKIQLLSADTTTGEIGENTIKNPLFSTSHKTVKRGDVAPISQSNLFGAALTLSDPDAPAKMADLISQVITQIENYRDDNGKLAGVTGSKTIVCANDARLKSVIQTALNMDMFKAQAGSIINLAYQAADLKYTAYLNDIVKNFVTTSGGTTAVPMFFIVDKAYNAENHGLEITERVPFTLNAFEKKEAPMGIKYEGRQRFDINVCTWRGITAVFLGTTVYHGTTSLAPTALTLNTVATVVKTVQ